MVKFSLVTLKNTTFFAFYFGDQTKLYIDEVTKVEEYRLYLYPSVSVNRQIEIKTLLCSSSFEGSYHTFTYINKIKRSRFCTCRVHSDRTA